MSAGVLQRVLQLLTGGNSLLKEVSSIFDMVRAKSPNDVNIEELRTQVTLKVKEYEDKELDRKFQSAMGQVELNKIGNQGARSFVFWITAWGWAWEMLLRPVVESFTVFIYAAPRAAEIQQLLPHLDMYQLAGMLFFLLGAYGLKSWQQTKAQGINKEAFFNAMRLSVGRGLNQKEVETLEKAIDKSTEEAK